MAMCPYIVRLTNIVRTSIGKIDIVTERVYENGDIDAEHTLVASTLMFDELVSFIRDSRYVKLTSANIILIGNGLNLNEFELEFYTLKYL